MSLPLLLSDWILALAFFLIAMQLVYIGRQRAEFRTCAIHWIFTVVTILTSLLFFTHAILSTRLTYDWLALRLPTIDIFIVTSAVWFFSAIRRIIALPKVAELERMFKARDNTLQKLIDRSPIAMVRFDRRGIVQDWNPAAEELFGWKREEVIGKLPPNFTPEKNVEFRKILSEAFNDEKFSPHFTKRLRKDGSIVDVCIWNAPLQTAASTEPSALAMIADVTKQRLLSEELAHAKTHAETANLQKSRFLAHMSHEIRTPLTAILGFADLLASERSDENRDIYTEAINRNGQALATLIDDMLDLSKIEAGEMKVIKKPFTVRELLNDVQASLDLKARKKEIYLVTSVDPQVPNHLIGDPMRIRQIVTNITGNAVKFTNRGGVSVKVTYENSCLHFRVKDTGSGISPEQVCRLFKPFSQAHSGVAQVYGGTGLGLSLSRELAHLMGGEVSLVSSSEDLGSEFALRLPVQIDPRVEGEEEESGEGQPSQLSSVPAPAKDRLLGRRILVADDAEDNLALISHYLEAAGAEVLTAHDGQEAIDIASEDHIDAVLMDLQMPHMNGVSALKVLKQKNFKSDIIALTASNEANEREHCLSLGFSDYLTKPIQPAHLVNTVALHMLH